MSEYRTTVNGLTVFVDKVGGGTVGRSYDGDWTVTVKNGSVFVYDNDTMTSGTAKTHAETAKEAAWFASALIDSASMEPEWAW